METSILIKMLTTMFFETKTKKFIKQKINKFPLNAFVDKSKNLKEIENEPWF